VDYIAENFFPHSKREYASSCWILLFLTKKEIGYVVQLLSLNFQCFKNKKFFFSYCKFWGLVGTGEGGDCQLVAESLNQGFLTWLACLECKISPLSCPSAFQ